MDGLGEQYKDEDEFLWYVTECLTVSRKKGKAVAKKTLSFGRMLISVAICLGDPTIFHRFKSARLVPS
jgi:hypothetical protein